MDVDAILFDKQCRFSARALVIAAGSGSGFPEKAGLTAINDLAMGVQTEAETSGV
ncbi:hypothetical protein ACFLXC_02550 [Chloroflexota bacterium]